MMSKSSAITIACSRIAKRLRLLSTADARRYVSKNIMESIKLLNTKFSTADAEYPEIHQQEGDVILRYEDWQEQIVEIFFTDPVAFRWQMAEPLLEGERDDSCYEVINSKWLLMHLTENVISKSEGYKHYKFNFNECGQFEILATGYTKQHNQQSECITGT